MGSSQQVAGQCQSASPQPRDLSGLARTSDFCCALVLSDRWGYPALYHPYLYHLTRLDHRHNFSPYFYPIYLLTSTSPSSDGISLLTSIMRSPLVSFVPQMGLSIGLGWVYGAKGELALAWTVATGVFVAFNKVVTSQVRSRLYLDQPVKDRANVVSVSALAVLPLVPVVPPVGSSSDPPPAMEVAHDASCLDRRSGTPPPHLCALSSSLC